MTTRELAKELDQLARLLRDASSEASAIIAERLELEKRLHGQDGGGKYRPRKLTLAGIAAAIASAGRHAGRRARELRRDVFDRRVEKLANQYTMQLESAVKRGSPVPRGVPVSNGFRPQRREGVAWMGDVLASFDRTPLHAECSAWSRAAHRVVVSLVPAYGYHDLDRAARAMERPGRDAYDIAEKWRESLRRWIDDHVEYLCDLDSGGKAVRINGIDPRPFTKLAADVQAGNADPLGIMRTP